MRATEDVSRSDVRQIFGHVLFWDSNQQIGNSIAVNVSQAGDSITHSVTLFFIGIGKSKDDTAISAAEHKSLTSVYVVRSKIGMVRNPHENVRDTVVVKIAHSGYRKAKKTPKLCWVGGLKIWVIEL